MRCLTSANQIGRKLVIEWCIAIFSYNVNSSISRMYIYFVTGESVSARRLLHQHTKDRRLATDEK
jgi:hypothetical protein